MRRTTRYAKGRSHPGCHTIQRTFACSPAAGRSCPRFFAFTNLRRLLRPLPRQTGVYVPRRLAPANPPATGPTARNTTPARQPPPSVTLVCDLRLRSMVVSVSGYAWRPDCRAGG